MSWPLAVLETFKENRNSAHAGGSAKEFTVILTGHLNAPGFFVPIKRILINV